MELFSVEKFVPEEHLLRKRDSAVQAIDSVVIFKMALIPRLYGLLSLRRTYVQVVFGDLMGKQMPRFLSIDTPKKQ